MNATALIPRKEFAALMGVNCRTLDRWRDAGLHGLLLPAVWVGGRCFFVREAFDDWTADVRAQVRRMRQERVEALKPARPMTRAERRDVEKAEQRLRRQGILK